MDEPMFLTGDEREARAPTSVKHPVGSICPVAVGGGAGKEGTYEVPLLLPPRTDGGPIAIGHATNNGRHPVTPFCHSCNHRRAPPPTAIPPPCPPSPLPLAPGPTPIRLLFL